MNEILPGPDERAAAIDAVVATETPSTKVIPPRVLLAEDEVDSRELLASLLRDSGYDVEEACDGRDALAAVLRQRPSLIITDCNMPYMTGNELVETLVLDESLRSIPVIVISALKQPPMPANVIVFLAKPFTIQKLRDAVCYCLASSKTVD